MGLSRSIGTFKTLFIFPPINFVVVVGTLLQTPGFQHLSG